MIKNIFFRFKRRKPKVHQEIVNIVKAESESSHGDIPLKESRRKKSAFPRWGRTFRSSLKNWKKYRKNQWK